MRSTVGLRQRSANGDLSSVSDALTSVTRGKQVFFTSKKRPVKVGTRKIETGFEGFYYTQRVLDFFLPSIFKQILYYCLEVSTLNIYFNENISHIDDPQNR